MKIKYYFLHLEMGTCSFALFRAIWSQSPALWFFLSFFLDQYPANNQVSHLVDYVVMQIIIAHHIQKKIIISSLRDFFKETLL